MLSNEKNTKKKTVSWDYLANIYDIYVYLINRKTHETLVKEIASLILPTDEVLECACGTGMLTKVMAPKCKKLVATDFSKNMLKKTKKKCDKYVNIEYMTADVMQLDFEDESFDKVVAGNVIHLLDEPVKALNEFIRVCRSGGQIIIPTYVNKESGVNPFVKFLQKTGIVIGQKFTFTTYKQFFIEAGLSDVEYIMINGMIPCAVAIISKNGRR